MAQIAAGLSPIFNDERYQEKRNPFCEGRHEPQPNDKFPSC